MLILKNPSRVNKLRDVRNTEGNWPDGQEGSNRCDISLILSYTWHSQKLMQTKLNYCKVGYDIGYYFFISLYITEVIQEEKDAGSQSANLDNVFYVVHEKELWRKFHVYIFSQVPKMQV